RPSGPDGTELRFNWNAGIAVDPFDPNTLYYGSQFVHKSTNRGDAWTIISPDLTTNNKDWQKQHLSGGLTFDVTGAENFTTLITIAPSAVERGVIWTGSDDGRLHVTRDGGANWTSVEANIKGVPKNSWIPHVEPSKYDAGTAFVVFDNHRRSDLGTYVFKTSDYGKSWTSLVTKDLRGYALVVEQDPVDPDLLFLGTEMALYASTDGGKNWLRLKHGLPTASYMALMVHPREHDLVIGTHGRAAYILDDIRPLRALTGEIARKPIHLFEIAEAQQYRVRQTGGERFAGDSEFRGENRPYGAILTFVLNAADLPHPMEEQERERKQRERDAKREKAPTMAATGVPAEAGKDVPREPVEAKGEEEERDRQRGPRATITVSDESGKKIRTFTSPVTQGINRAVWNLRRDSFKEPPRERPDWADEPSGPEVPPGKYSVTVKYKEQSATETVNVVGDPRFQISPADRKAKWDAVVRAGEMQEVVADAIDRITKTRSDIDAVIARRQTPPKPGERPAPDTLVIEGRRLKQRLDVVEKMFWVPPKTKGIVSDADVALSKIGYVQSALSSSYDAPTPAQLAYLRQAEARLEQAVSEMNRLFAEDVARFREAVRKSELQLFPELKPLTVKRE
ncbi:MAG TPA: hypothetical protein VFL80_02745, partial [Thermoanaerobaculia bacterium]|nr:hypothetical protein [Thermoanaerobaculia bacterium]